MTPLICQPPTTDGPGDDYERWRRDRERQGHHEGHRSEGDDVDPLQQRDERDVFEAYSDSDEGGNQQEDDGNETDSSDDDAECESDS